MGKRRPARRLRQGGRGPLIEGEAALEEEIVGLQITGRPGPKRLLGTAGQPDLERRADGAGDLFLHLEDIGDIPVVAVGPELVAVVGIDQLGADPQAAPAPPHTPLQHRADTEPVPHLLHVDPGSPPHVWLVHRISLR